jgi:hypothetical protein
MRARNLKIFIIVGQLLVLSIFNFHCLNSTTTNHTGLDLSFWASLSFVFGTALLLTSKYKPNLIGKTDKLIVIIFIISILATLNILLFDHYNIFVEYESWMKRNMPQKPF